MHRIVSKFVTCLLLLLDKVHVGTDKLLVKDHLDDVGLIVLNGEQEGRLLLSFFCQKWTYSIL